MKVLAAGTVINCPTCYRELFRTARPIFTGDPVKADQFVSFAGVPEPRDGYEIRCPFCKEWLLAHINTIFQQESRERTIVKS